MASANSLLRCQIPVGCQLCETGTTIKWRCKDCSLLICDTCRKVHLKLSKEHDIKNIKDIQEDNIIKDGDKIGIEIDVVGQYKVDTKHIYNLAVSKDGSLWIGDSNPNKLLHVKLCRDVATIISTINIKSYSLDISPLGSPFVVGESPSTLKIIDEMTGEVIDSKFKIYNWVVICVHVTKNMNIILGAHKGGSGRIIVMDQNAKHLNTFGKADDKQLLSYPRSIATVSNGNIFISDKCDEKCGRVVMIKPDRDRFQYYHGKSGVNTKSKPFLPVSLLVTKRDNVLMTELNTDFLHILNSEGVFLTCFNLRDIGIVKPFSLASSPSGKLYVGTVRRKTESEGTKAILYKLEYSGV